ncbi:hypothetical protein [Vreelandella populi]|uniref:hypothetical protein n=1 Tax=Vreelandella populi TaxID=2498858 RepID=UPI000F8EBC8B|nr:hypothetical protein [Halomonas populi]RUR52724.1 hypothetical protein ELY40_11790 [Halomonas populi]
MTLTKYELTLLALRGIKPIDDLGNGTFRCMTSDGERYYTSHDLKQIAKPGFFDRFTAFMGVRHAS